MNIVNCPSEINHWHLHNIVENPETFSNTKEICISVKDFIDAGYSLSNRYLGTCAATNAASAHTKAVNIKHFIDDYETLFTNMRGQSGVAGNGVDLDD